MSATPTKRRALGALDVNVTRMPRSPSSSSSSSSPSKLTSKGLVAGSPLKKATGLSRHATPSPPRQETPRKRPLEAGEDAQPAVKKLCSESAPEAAALSPSKDANNPEGGCPRPTVEDAEEDEPPASQPTTARSRRSISPDASSLFDNSAIANTSQFTNVTEPDTTDAPITTTAAAAAAAAAPTPVSVTSSAVLNAVPFLPPPRPRRVPTREEFRQQAEILKLRLSLATYKVRTNQTDVPLDKLQVRPVPGMSPRCRTPLPSTSAHTIQRATPAQYWYRSAVRLSAAPASSRRVEADITVRGVDEEEDHAGGDGGGGGVVGGGSSSSPESPEKNALPRLPAATVSTPRQRRNVAADDEEERLTSSALRGGAAKGLLSLSQGSL